MAKFLSIVLLRLNMVILSYLNPFSAEGEGIVREKGSLDEVFEINTDLLRIVMDSKSQNLSNDNYIPQNYADLAVKRLEWYLRKKYDKKYDHNDYAFLLNPDIAQFDVKSYSKRAIVRTAHGCCYFSKIKVTGRAFHWNID